MSSRFLNGNGRQIHFKEFFWVFVVKKLPEDIVDSDSFKCSQIVLKQNQHMKICVHKTNKLKGDYMHHNYMEICLNVKVY